MYPKSHVNITLGQLGEGISKTAKTMNDEANKLMDEHRDADDKSENVVPAERKRAEELKQAADKIKKSHFSRHGKASSEYVLSQGNYELAVKAFENAKEQGGGAEKKLVTDFESVVSFMFAKDSEIRRFGLLHQVIERYLQQ